MPLFSRFLAPVLSGALLLATPLSAQAAGGASGGAQDSLSSSSIASSFTDALNALRAQNGRRPLREDSRLNRAAQAFAEDMARNSYFSHTGRDGSNVAQRARAAGCRGRGYYAENIAWGQRTGQDAFSGWAASSGHRTNMLGRNYGVFGLGQASGYWVMIFADGC